MGSSAGPASECHTYTSCFRVPYSGRKRAQLIQRRSLPLLPRLTWAAAKSSSLAGRDHGRPLLGISLHKKPGALAEQLRSTKGRQPAATQPQQPERGTQLAASGLPASLSCATAVLPAAAARMCQRCRRFPQPIGSRPPCFPAYEVSALSKPPWQPSTARGCSGRKDSTFSTVAALPPAAPVSWRSTASAAQERSNARTRAAVPLGLGAESSAQAQSPQQKDTARRQFNCAARALMLGSLGFSGSCAVTKGTDRELGEPQATRGALSGSCA